MSMMGNKILVASVLGLAASATFGGTLRHTVVVENLPITVTADLPPGSTPDRSFIDFEANEIPFPQFDTFGGLRTLHEVRLTLEVDANFRFIIQEVHGASSTRVTAFHFLYGFSILESPQPGNNASVNEVDVGSTTGDFPGFVRIGLLMTGDFLAVRAIADVAPYVGTGAVQANFFARERATYSRGSLDNSRYEFRYAQSSTSAILTLEYIFSAPAMCGDGVVDAGEQCDDGFADECGSCNATCTGPGTAATCGDGVVCPEIELCDDGLTDACGMCNATCTGPGIPQVCGDGILCPTLEACDDGLTDDCGSCNADCTGPGTFPACDDGNLCNGIEQCNGGECLPGTPVSCSFMDDECGTGVCVAETGLCEKTCAGSGAVCDAGSGAASGLCDVNCMCVALDPVPTTSAWGLAAFSLLLLAVGTLIQRRRVTRDT